jgi:LAO/AO transport system kinase
VSAGPQKDVADVPDAARYVDAVLARSRAGIARTITLVESSRPDHRVLAEHVLTRLLPHAGTAQRVGITGVPGVGKSTFIDALGGQLIDQGHRVAVLAVDPSSTRSGGSILGDKTRMTRLANDGNAFIRPSPSAGTLGGVAKATRETMLVMEAAGYDIVLVETVGVGQSEYVVADMVDTFLFLTLARTGDQLQGMKRGILELADVIGVNKSDGEHTDESQRAARELSGALRLLRGGEDDWQAPVVPCSARQNENLDRVWNHVQRHRDWLQQHGEFEAKRRRQLVEWTRAMVRDRVLSRLDEPQTRSVVKQAEAAVLEGTMTPDQAATQILDSLG